MKFLDIENSLKQSAFAYYGNDHDLASYLLQGCLRQISLLNLNIKQATYLNIVIKDITDIANRCDFTRLADLIMFELVQNFPDFCSLVSPDTQNSAQN